MLVVERRIIVSSGIVTVLSHKELTFSVEKTIVKITTSSSLSVATSPTSVAIVAH